MEATGGVRGGHSHSPNAAQSETPLDRGVDPEHLRSPSQGARPEGIDDAVDPRKHRADVPADTGNSRLSKP